MAKLITLIYRLHGTGENSQSEFSHIRAPRLGSFRGVFVCAARGRARHNKIAARIQAAGDREVTCSHANDNAVEHSGLVSTIGERPRISRRVHVRLNVPT